MLYFAETFNFVSAWRSNLIRFPKFLDSSILRPLWQVEQGVDSLLLPNTRKSRGKEHNHELGVKGKSGIFIKNYPTQLSAFYPIHPKSYTFSRGRICKVWNWLIWLAYSSLVLKFHDSCPLTSLSKYGLRDSYEHHDISKYKLGNGGFLQL